MRSSTGSIVLSGRCLCWVIRLAIDRLSSLAPTLPFILALALSFLFLLSLFPFLSNFLEFYMFLSAIGAKEFTSVHQRCSVAIASTPTIGLMLCNPTKHHEPNQKRDFATTKIRTYLLESVYYHETASLHAHLSGSTCRMPSHNLATRICTCARFLRSDDADACAAAHLELEQMNTPATEGEDSVHVF